MCNSSWFSIAETRAINDKLWKLLGVLQSFWNIEQPSQTLIQHHWLEHGWTHAFFYTLIYLGGNTKCSIHQLIFHNEVIAIANYSWISIHVIVVKLWKGLNQSQSFLTLQQVVESSNVDNLIKVVMDFVLAYGGLLKSNLSSNFVLVQIM